ncbi:MAG: DUF3291 domain-containing protein [Aliiglaciecola sp.]
MEFHLAQLNIARALGAMDSAVMKEFSDGLVPVNATAEASEGFVWRLQDENGDATNIQFFDDPNMLVNMSVWRDIASLKHFMFKTHHASFMANRKSWFESSPEATYVLWWIEQGHIPSLEEAIERLDHLRKHGDTAYAFSFKQIFHTPE